MAAKVSCNIPTHLQGTRCPERNDVNNTKKKAGGVANMAPGYSRVIPLNLGHAYVSTAAGKTLHVKVGSVAFFNAIATLIGCPAQSVTAAHCAALAEINAENAEAWVNAHRLLAVDTDGNPLLTLGALLAP
jgi:hypothetical protein